MSWARDDVSAGVGWCEGTVFDGVVAGGGAGCGAVVVVEGGAIEEEVSVARVSTAFSVFTEQAANVQRSANARNDDFVIDCLLREERGRRATSYP
jgi:hypothetical protein